MISALNKSKPLFRVTPNVFRAIALDIAEVMAKAEIVTLEIPTCGRVNKNLIPFQTVVVRQATLSQAISLKVAKSSTKGLNSLFMLH